MAGRAAFAALEGDADDAATIAREDRGDLGLLSRDHALWFHRPARFDDWLLFTSDSPVAHGARAMIFGEMWSRDGARVASVAQEGLIRIPRDQPSK